MRPGAGPSARSLARLVRGPGLKLVIFSEIAVRPTASQIGSGDDGGGGDCRQSWVNGRCRRQPCVNILSLDSVVLGRKCQEALRQILKMEMKFH